MVVIYTITTNQQTKLTNGSHDYGHDKSTDYYTYTHTCWDCNPHWDDEQAYHVIQYGVGAFSAHAQITK